MATKKAKKKPVGRPIDPGGLRQAGTILKLRLSTALKARAERRAGAAGLSDYIRGLIEADLAR